jgi:type II secretory pathway component PulC
MQRIVKVAFVTGCRSDESGSCGEGMIEAVLVSGWADHTNAKQQVSLMFESQSLQGIIDKMNRFDINPEPSPSVSTSGFVLSSDSESPLAIRPSSLEERVWETISMLLGETFSSSESSVSYSLVSPCT